MGFTETHTSEKLRLYSKQKVLQGPILLAVPILVHNVLHDHLQAMDAERFLKPLCTDINLLQ